MKPHPLPFRPRRPRTTLATGVALSATLFATPLLASDGGPDDGHARPDDGTDDLHLSDPSGALEEQDEANPMNFIVAGPNARVTKNLDVVGRGERNVADATTDVWVYDGYAYTGTFNDPCGGDPEAGIWIWDVGNKNKPSFVGVVQSPEGSRTNDVRVDGMNSGTILVHSNESCDGGPGGFEVYDVDDPENPVLLSSVRIDELNSTVSDLFGGVTDVGVHNLWLFTQGANDYVGVTSEGVFDNFRIYDITDPAAPTLVSGWGAEELFDPGVGDSDDPDRVLAAALDLLDGFGSSANKFLHDVTVTEDGTRAYLANWDAGLVLLDISNPTEPTVVSVAIDPENGSLDGEVNSHSVWPSEDGTIVVEGEEDFDAWETTVAPGNVTFGGGNPIPGVIASTAAGDAFEANPLGALTLTADAVTVTDGALAGEIYAVNEFSDNNFSLGDGSVSGNYVFIGQACNGDDIANPLQEGDIAVARRGACPFAEKSVNAANAGASAIIVTNNNPESTPWSGLRIWDYSDPANPVLASTYDTVCSASTAPSEECAANGTYSVHNVQLETRGNKVYAYVSWYWDGMIVLDVTDPYRPVEVARYLDTTGPNDGLANDFWGVYKEENSPFLYGSDRNGGLYVFKLKGKGSGK